MTEQPGIRAHTIGPSENDGCAAYLHPVSLGGSPESADEELHESNDHIGQDKKSHQIADSVRLGLVFSRKVLHAEHAVLRVCRR